MNDQGTKIHPQETGLEPTRQSVCLRRNLWTMWRRGTHRTERRRETGQAVRRGESRRDVRARLTREAGLAIFLVLAFALLLGFSALFFLEIFHSGVRDARRARASSRALYLADAGIQKALWELGGNPAGYGGEKKTRLGSGSYTVEVRRKGPGLAEVTSTGSVPFERGRIMRRVRVQLRLGPGGKLPVITEWKEL